MMDSTCGEIVGLRRHFYACVSFLAFVGMTALES